MTICLTPLFGNGSLDYGNEDKRFEVFFNGTSALGNNLLTSILALKQLSPDHSAGPLSLPPEGIRPNSNFDGKMQRDITKAIEEKKSKSIKIRYDSLNENDRRRQTFKNRLPTSTACLTTTPSQSTQVPQNLFTGLVALTFGALDPNISAVRGATIGNSRLIVDVNGDTLAVAILPGDRWRSSHDVLKNFICMDARMVGVNIKKEVYGLFLRHFSTNGLDQYNRANKYEKKTNTIIPDLMISSHPDGSPLQAPGNQMIEIKRIQSPQTFDRETRQPKGTSKLYEEKSGVSHVRAANRRAAAIPGEYERKAKKADVKYGPADSREVLKALKDMPEVIGLAFGAFGEFSDSVNLIIKAIAHEGALLNSDK